jgi:hypothetical protein
MQVARRTQHSRAYHNMVALLDSAASLFQCKTVWCNNNVLAMSRFCNFRLTLHWKVSNVMYTCLYPSRRQSRVVVKCISPSPPSLQDEITKKYLEDFAAHTLACAKAEVRNRDSQNAHTCHTCLYARKPWSNLVFMWKVQQEFMRFQRCQWIWDKAATMVQ